YVLCGDGCLMEGIASEAASLAGTLGLGKLIVLYDSNSITIEGSTDIAFTEDVCARFEAYGWQTLSVADGNDTDIIAAAIDEAKAEKNKPTLIKITTEIGYGAPNAGTSQVHGEALGAEKLAKLKENLEMPAGDFIVADEVYAHMNEIVSDLNKNEDEWNNLFADYAKKYPELAKEWEALMSGKLDMSALDSDEFWSFENKANATRNLSGEMINRLAKIMPSLFGGSADLAPSNKTNIKEGGDFSKNDYAGRNIHFGVREHAMGAIANAMAAYGGIHPFVATFFVFSDYLKPAMRLSALMELPVTYIFSHDSIGVGEDGPTHQPIEQLAAMRSIPGFVDFRPADGHETAAAWYYAVTNGKHPVGIALTRQNLPYYEETGKAALKGGYVLRDSDNAEVILIGSGSELELCYKAYDELKAEGIAARVVSMPSVALFEMQSEEYRESVLPKSIRARVFVEAGCGFGLDRYVGLDGAKICMEGFGASAPYSKLFPKFGFTVENVVATAKKLVK
ncbi:MAG: transketolase, partial [Oscillospiraceae bacterium]|nr:transketolase [Oscillospiraceae bacterium]